MELSLFHCGSFVPPSVLDLSDVSECERIKLINAQPFCGSSQQRLAARSRPQPRFAPILLISKFWYSIGPPCVLRCLRSKPELGTVVKLACPRPGYSRSCELASHCNNHLTSIVTRVMSRSSHGLPVDSSMIMVYGHRNNATHLSWTKPSSGLIDHTSQGGRVLFARHPL